MNQMSTLLTISAFVYTGYSGSNYAVTCESGNVYVLKLCNGYSEEEVEAQARCDVVCLCHDYWHFWAMCERELVTKHHDILFNINDLFCRSNWLHTKYLKPIQPCDIMHNLRELSRGIMHKLQNKCIYSKLSLSTTLSTPEFSLTCVIMA